MTRVLDHEISNECVSFLYREAELLDRRRFPEWLDMLSPDIAYKAPVRTTLDMKAGDGFSRRAYFFDEDYGALALRVERLKSAFAWSENPPTRTRRLITNIRAGEPEAEDEQPLSSNFALYAYRGDRPEPRILTGERQDVLRRTDRRWLLASRLILLDTTVLGMDSLSVFL